MRSATSIGLLLAAATLSLAACADKPQEADKSAEPSTHAADQVRKQLPGSTRQYTQAEIDNYYAAFDWYPDHHPPIPKPVSHGDGGKIKACTSCHLTSGLGHPESANMAGLPQSYPVRQIVEYKTRALRTQSDARDGGCHERAGHAGGERGISRR